MAWVGEGKGVAWKGERAGDEDNKRNGTGWREWQRNCSVTMTHPNLAPPGIQVFRDFFRQKCLLLLGIYFACRVMHCKSLSFYRVDKHL